MKYRSENKKKKDKVYLFKKKTHNVQWNQVLLKSNGSFALVRMNQVVEISDQKFNVKFKII